MNPHSQSGWKKFFPNVPDKAERHREKGGKCAADGRDDAVIVLSLGFTHPGFENEHGDGGML